MKTKLLVAGIVFSFIAFANKHDDIIFYRVQYFYSIKAEIAKIAWPPFHTQLKEPFLYFTDSASYAVNPTPKFLSQVKAEFIKQHEGIKLYKTAVRLDNLPFHMENRLSTGSDTMAYTHHQPFLMCSSFEDTKKVITNLTADDWAGMIVHEFFHNYQFRHVDFAKNVLALYTSGSIGDTLQSFYLKHSWYKQKVDYENALLLKALALTHPDSVKNVVDVFLAARKARRKETLSKLKLSIDEFEKRFETYEGTARYVEVAVFKNLPEIKPPEKLLRLDTLFRNYKSADANKFPAWIYDTAVSTNYMYAMGYNTTRLLQKLGVKYQTVLFKNPDLNLEDLLKGK